MANILFNRDAAVLFLEMRGIIPTEMACESCATKITLSQFRQTFRCPKKSCRREFGRFRGTFFDKSKLSPEKLLYLGFEWLKGSSHTKLCMDESLSTKTVTSYIKYFRQLVSNMLDESHCTIGGEGIVVEVDESKLAKRKYNRGHIVHGV
jgi:hypothetical protein